MPALSSSDLSNTLVARNASTANVTSDNLQVICAWPVSGQYGPGARLLYYFLVAACVLARRSEWLRNACLAAALLLPAIAAVHGITLAALHVDGATDMDIYGTFQLCAIGILAAPVTAKHSRTYFNDPSRNLIFLWTGLVLAGLVSLTVEFFRAGTTTCTQANAGYPVSPDPNQFQYNVSCGLVCDTNAPISPMRGGSANNIYVIPAPYILTFGTVTLLAAACCIPAILSLMSMWNKILQVNWKRTWGRKNEEESSNEPIEGTNGVTVAELHQVNNYIKWLLNAVEVPVFGAAVFGILIAGEMNFWSGPVQYQSEPIAAIGQWSPIAGTVFALLGSLYLIVAVDKKAEATGVAPNPPEHQCTCGSATHRDGSPGAVVSSRSDISTPDIREDGDTVTVAPTTTQDTSEHRHHRLHGLEMVDVASRRKVRRWMHTFVDRVGTPAPQLFDESAFKHGKARDFPVVPGEENRVEGLRQMLEHYNQERDEEELTPSLRPQLSRSGSFIESVISRTSTDTTRQASTSIHSPPPSTLSPIPGPATPRRLRVNTLPTQTSADKRRSSSPLPAGPSSGSHPRRRETLDVSSPASRSPMRGSPRSPLRERRSVRASSPMITVPGGLASPAIVVTSSPEATSDEAPPSSP